MYIICYLKCQYDGVADEGEYDAGREDWVSGQLQQTLLPLELWHISKLGLCRESIVQAVPLGKHTWKSMIQMYTNICTYYNVCNSHSLPTQLWTYIHTHTHTLRCYTGTYVHNEL